MHTPFNTIWKRTLCTSVALAATAGSVLAQAAPAPAENPTNSLINQMLMAVALLSVLVLLLLVTLLILISYLLKTQLGINFSLIPKINVGFLWHAKAATKGEVADTALDHNYDGIIELDNAAPPLFNYILYGTIAFAVVYLLNFHVFRGAPSQAEEYKQEMILAAEQKAAAAKDAKEKVDETTATVLTAATDLAAGKSIYITNCAACHGQLGEGGVGPNMTDQYWLHGGDVKDLFRTIKKGVANKGMVAWESQLSPLKIQQTASYILSLQGTNPPNAKAPQGELYKPAPPAEPVKPEAKPADAKPGTNKGKQISDASKK